MTERRVGIVFSSREWRRPLQQHVRNHVAGIRLVLIRDERTVLDEPLDALVVDDETSFLTPDVVEGLRGRGVRLIGVHDGTPGGQHRLASLGIDVTVPSDASPRDFVTAIEAVDGRMASDFARLAAQFEDDADALELGSVIAVGGPPASGKTEVAIALADLLARTAPTLLVDAADLHPSLARRLHLRSPSPPARRHGRGTVDCRAEHRRAAGGRRTGPVRGWCRLPGAALRRDLRSGEPERLAGRAAESAAPVPAIASVSSSTSRTPWRPSS